jgi:hypothetical protein
VKPLMESYLSKLPIRVYIHDCEVPLGRPEHLVFAVHGENTVQLRQSYVEFERLLHNVIERSGGSLTEEATKTPFHASLEEDGSLSIERDGIQFLIDADHLRGLWYGLTRGLLTRDVVRWSAGDQADCVISLLSLLPDVRPVQVQEMRAAEPEIALELRRRNALAHREVDHAEKISPSWA